MSGSTCRHPTARRRAVPRTLEEVERALASAHHQDAGIVADADGTVLASRDSLPGGCAVLIVLGAEGHRYEPRPEVEADARRRSADLPPEGTERVSRAVEPERRGSLPR